MTPLEPRLILDFLDESDDERNSVHIEAADFFHQPYSFITTST